MRALLVEDSRSLRSSIVNALEATGYDVWAEADGSAGLVAAQAREYDVLILDLMLPGLGGLEIIQTLRAEGNDVPILCLTAMDTLEDKVNGLSVGADDYLVKPFEIRELLARVFAQCRRGRPGVVNGAAKPSREVAGPRELLRYVDVELDVTAGRATRAGVELNLQAREFNLLAYFLARPERVVSSVQIEAALYPDSPPSSNAVAAAICNLRRHLKIQPDAAPLILTRRGLGYVLSDTTP